MVVEVRKATWFGSEQLAAMVIMASSRSSPGGWSPIPRAIASWPGAASCRRRGGRSNNCYIPSREDEATNQLSSVIFRKFGEELNAFLGKNVVVVNAEGKEYSGHLVGVDERLNLVLDKVVGAGPNIFKIAINGHDVREIRLTDRPFDFKALGERLTRVFPGLVVVREDIGAIIVMEKIKVTDKGVTDGTGLAADKVRTIFDEYMREPKKAP
jgi:small nuclear ribonucleoprotein (snRNP)-like protein